MYVSGSVKNVMFANEASEFYIFRLKDDVSGKLYTIKGNVDGMTVKAGTWLGLEGKWIEHPKFGKQIQIEHAPVMSTKEGGTNAPAVLNGAGVGKMLIAKMTRHFGEDKLEEGLMDPVKLAEVPGLDEVMANMIHRKWVSSVAYHHTTGFLRKIGIHRTKIKKIWQTFGSDAKDVLAKNPWAMTQIEGITFAQADKAAKSLNLDMMSQKRIEGAILAACKEARGMGHLYVNGVELVRRALRICPGFTSKQAAQGLKACAEEKLLVIDRETKSGTTAVYEPWFYRVEEESAKLLLQRENDWNSPEVAESRDEYRMKLGKYGPKTRAIVEAGETLDEVVGTALEEWADLTSVNLSDTQLEGVRRALLDPVSVITGLPGTGKTLSTKAIVTILQDAGVDLLIIAPTGIAAKRIANVTGREAFTVHKAFGATLSEEVEERKTGYHGVLDSAESAQSGDVGDSQWSYGIGAPHPADFVIVDESSMVDQALLYRILSCTKKTCRIVLVGDHAQLPSVGPGNVLRDVIESGKFPVTKLTEIFRQEGTNYIVEASHLIHSGQMPDVTSPDFRLIAMRRDEEALEATMKVAKKLHMMKADFQVLSPRHSGTIGVTNLNTHLRELLNPKGPGKIEHRIGDYYIREGDQIMVTKNNYKLNISNGEIGKVYKVKTKAKEVVISIDGIDKITHVALKFSEVPKYIRLSYATTIHKVQGNEFDYVVKVVSRTFGNQLQRNLLYTGVTRAKKKVILIGQEAALDMAISNSKKQERRTLFVDRLDK